MSIMSRLLKTQSKDSLISVLTDSEFGTKVPLAKTPIKMINLMLSGDLNGGVCGGATMVVGDSRSYKSLFCLHIVKAFLDGHKDAICLFFDSEAGASKEYFKQIGVDSDRVLHIPTQNVEQLKFDLCKFLDVVQGDEKVSVFIDSISQTPSKREVENALAENGAADMSRASALNSLWRIITPILNIKNIPLLAINSFYDDMANKYAEKHIKGGKQGFLSSDTILFVSRSQEKDEKTKELLGFTFNYKIMKSRFVREGSKLPIEVSFDEGINNTSGIFELAKDAGFIQSPKQGWYILACDIGMNTEKNYRRSELDCDAVLEKVCAIQGFIDYCEARYKLTPRHDLTLKVDLDTGEVLKR